MRRVALREGADLAGFRQAIRTLLAAGIPPREVVFDAGVSGELFGGAEAQDAPPVTLPRALVAMIGQVVPHRDPERYGLLYEVVWRVAQGERGLLETASDPVMHRLHLITRAIRRDIHKMHAYLRFRRVEPCDGLGPYDGTAPCEGPGPHDGPAPRPGQRERYAAWFEPDHYILEAASSFFVERFRAMDWTIVTPVGSAIWEKEQLSFGPAGTKRDVPGEDSFEAGWTGYYESTFNPARANPKLMRQHMAKKYWHNMPEAAAIPNLLRAASGRVTDMLDKEPTMPVKREPTAALARMTDQEPSSLAELGAIIRAAGPLVQGATQAVLGEGPSDAAIVMVGEQPGDEEDLKGRPFVGPAGRLLDRAMGEAGIDRSRIYLTNAVKHFKFEQRGKRRIHSKPTAGEVSHYRWWLLREIELIGPKLVVALGATAVLALTGKQVPITRARGPASLLGERRGYITVHPSYLLRLPDEAAKAEAYTRFVQDLAEAKTLGETLRAAA